MLSPLPPFGGNTGHFPSRSRYIPRTDLCLVMAILIHLADRGSGPGSLLRFSDGCSMTRGRFVMQMRDALDTAGVDKAKYCGHSFRLGGATTAAVRGIEDSIIKTLGRQYDRIP